MSGNHYILLPETPWAGPSGFQVDGPRLILYRGVWVSPPNERLRYELRVDGKAKDPTAFPPLDLMEASDGHLLVSPGLEECLSNAGVANVQYFDAEVTYRPTGTLVPYRVANILGLVAAFDRQASECELSEDGEVIDFLTLRLDEVNADGHDLFRLYESFQTIIVSERVKACLEAARVTGLRVIAPEQWIPGML